MRIPLAIPSEAAINHSQQLQKLIKTEIAHHNGKISFARYMELALYAPGLGYYNTGTQKFGSSGDFITAPEVSDLFSKCLAQQCQQVLTHYQGKGNILEIGAGSGQMAADILLALETMDALPNHYFILELSAALKARQQEKLQALCPQLLPRVQWLSTLPSPGFKGIILANEVLDAMPVHRFQISDQMIYEWQVCINPSNDTLECKPYLNNNKALLELFRLQSWPQYYCSEINLNLKPWVLSLADILSSGVILLIDYGFPFQEYYHPDRNEGTLMCHYQHQAHSDPFFYPGLQDITAHVDFSAVAAAGVAAHLDILGYTTQANFLMGCGLMQRLEESQNHSIQAQARLNQALNTLTSPAEMGELFKVIALGRDFEAPLIGFDFNDRQHVL